MLKNKKAIYILLPINILVWGFFIYRFLSLSQQDPAMAMTTGRSLKKADLTEDSVQYMLDLGYKDPFLKDSKPVNRFFTDQPASPERQVKSKPVPPPPEPVKKAAPDIKYLGLVKNSSSGVSTALVSFNGQSKLIKPNDVIDGICFKQFNKDSLLARCGKENIVVKR